MSRKPETIQAIINRTEKVCSACKAMKPLAEFHKYHGNLDGHYSVCKKCRVTKTHESYLRRKDKVLKSSKAYRKTADGKIARIHEHSRMIAKHPEKYKAHYLLHNAVRDGRLEQLPCEICGDKLSQGHHDDYDKPLVVRWLCRKHHQELHNKQRLDKLII